MRKFLAIVTVIACAATGFAGDIFTADGQSYRNIQVKETTPLGITATITENGQEQAVWIPYGNMSPADQRQYGYDANKANEFIARLNNNKSAMDDGTIVSSPKGQVKDKSFQLPKSDNPIQGNQLNYNSASGVTPVIAGGINPNAIAVATPGTYAKISTQQIAASLPGAGFSVAPSGIGVNTPVGNFGISPYAIGINTPVANVAVTPDYIAAQTAVGAVSITPGPLPCYNVAPAVIPVVGVPLAASTVPQPYYYTTPVAVATAPGVPVAYNTPTPVIQYANPVIYNDGMPQSWIIYNGAYVPYANYYGYGGWGSNWCYYNNAWYPANYYFGVGYMNRGYNYGWRNPHNWYRGRYWAGNYRGGNGYRGGRGNGRR